jgi:lipoprotein-anchoring transpeptidase ErfK/SrfK
MMIKKILTIGAAVAAAAAGTSLAQAQQSYPVPPGAVYSAAPGYPPGGYVVDERRTPLPPDFDELEDDDAPNGPASTALPTPGPVLSPSDPRYGRPVYSNVPPPAPTGPILSPDDPRYGRPAYSNVQPPAPTGPILSPDDPRYGRPAYSAAPPPAPTGPVMSPDDPRYGRPAGPPAVIYGDRPPGSAPAATYNDDALRPPGAIGAAPAVTGALPQQPQVGADGRPVQLSALPPEEQPEVGPAQLPPHLRRQEVAFATKEPAGTIVVDTSNTYLYYVLGNGRAMRYGVRVGREGFTWTGVQKITKKTEWPDWHPPTEMIERQPYLPRFMAGGPGNPLGARAMYLGSTVYRIHGTNQPSTIGKFVSSGCIGMLNEDVSDLFERTKVGTRVVVMPGGPPPGVATAAATQPASGTTTAAAGAPVAATPPARVSGSGVGQGPAVVPPLPPATTIR